MITNHQIFYNDTNLDKTSSELWFTEIENSWEQDQIFKIIENSNADRIIFISSEAKNFYFEEKVFENKKVYFFLPSVIDNERYHPYMFWFDWVRQVEEFTNLSSYLIPFDQKNPEFMFDSLLGIMDSRLNKIFLDEQIQQNRSFFLHSKNASIENGKLVNWIPGGKHDIGDFRINFNNGQQANVDCFIPYELYNNSWYTAVAETRFQGPCFFTEKTARPIIAKRLFVHFGAPYHLAGLKTLGYKTFDSVIDESYDIIDDNQQRWEAAWQQIIYLMTQDPVEIYKKIEPVLNHNKQLLMNTNCYDSLIKDINNMFCK